MSKILKYTVRAIAFIICGLFIWRVIFSQDKSTLSDLVATPSLISSFADDGDVLLYTHDVPEEISENGYFSAYAFVYSPTTRELEVTVRYNTSTVDALGDVEFRLFTVDTSSGTPAEDGEETDERLYQGYPASGDSFPTYEADSKKLFYNYKRLVFENVEIGEHTNVIISIVKAGTAESDQNYEAAIAVHFAEQPMKTYKLSKAERNALSGTE